MYDCVVLFFSLQFFEGTGGGKNEKKVTFERSHEENSFFQPSVEFLLSVPQSRVPTCLNLLLPLCKERAWKLPAVDTGLVAGGTRFS